MRRCRSKPGGASPAARDAVEAEAASLPLPGVQGKIVVRWGSEGVGGFCTTRTHPASITQKRLPSGSARIT